MTTNLAHSNTVSKYRKFLTDSQLIAHEEEYQRLLKENAQLKKNFRTLKAQKLYDSFAEERRERLNAHILERAIAGQFRRY